MGLYLSLTIWWVVFFAAHSILASSALKSKINILNPIFKSYYRLCFNIISTLLLIPIIYTFFQLPAEYLIKTSFLYQLVGSLLSAAGVFIVIGGFKNYRSDEFIGIYQIKNHHEFHPSTLNRSSWNSIVRHPLYFGGIILIVGILLITPTIKLSITSLLAIVYLYFGTLWEEKKLIAEFGSTYKDYQREVSMLLPIKWLLSKIS